jgi:anti-sigma B factor antagonist
MTITSERDGSTLSIALTGRLDTTSAPELEEMLKTSLDGVRRLIIDCAQLAYISSAGLRVLFSIHKVMKERDGMKMIHVNEDNMDVLSLTGYTEFLDIE